MLVCAMENLATGDFIFNPFTQNVAIHCLLVSAVVTLATSQVPDNK